MLMFVVAMTTCQHRVSLQLLIFIPFGVVLVPGKVT